MTGGFRIKDYKYLEKTDKLKNVLNDYNGVIPILLKPFSDYLTYEKRLKEKGIFDKTMEEQYQIRIEHLKSDDKDKFREDELIRWVKENEEFNTILLNSLKKQ